MPRLDDGEAGRLVPIVGLPPHLINMPPTCAFPTPVQVLRGGVHDRAVARACTGRREHHVAVAWTLRGGSMWLAETDEVLNVDALKMYYPVTRGF